MGDMDFFMKGDIHFDTIKKVLLDKYHDGNTHWLSMNTLDNLKCYRHCTTSMGYSAEFIAGCLSVLAKCNNYKVFV